MEFAKIGPKELRKMVRKINEGRFQLTDFDAAFLRQPVNTWNFNFYNYFTKPNYELWESTLKYTHMIEAMAERMETVI